MNAHASDAIATYCLVVLPVVSICFVWAKLTNRMRHFGLAAYSAMMGGAPLLLMLVVR